MKWKYKLYLHYDMRIQLMDGQIFLLKLKSSFVHNFQSFFLNLNQKYFQIKNNSQCNVLAISTKVFKIFPTFVMLSFVIIRKLLR